MVRKPPPLSLESLLNGLSHLGLDGGAVAGEVALKLPLHARGTRVHLAARAAALSVSTQLNCEL
jgi:hypothetical protein